MLIAYQPIFEAKAVDSQPEVFAGVGGSAVMISLRTSDFSIHHKDGKAEINLSRHLTAEECRALGKALINAAYDSEASWQVFVSGGNNWSSPPTPEPPPDPTCPACDGRGRLER